MNPSNDQAPDKDVPLSLDELAGLLRMIKPQYELIFRKRGDDTTADPNGSQAPLELSALHFYDNALADLERGQEPGTNPSSYRLLKELLQTHISLDAGDQANSIPARIAERLNGKVFKASARGCRYDVTLPGPTARGRHDPYGSSRTESKMLFLKVNARLHDNRCGAPIPTGQETVAFATSPDRSPRSMLVLGLLTLATILVGAALLALSQASFVARGTVPSSAVLTFKPETIGQHMAKLAGSASFEPSEEWFEVGVTEKLGYSVDARNGRGLFHHLQPGRRYYYRYVAKRNGWTCFGTTDSFVTSQLGSNGVIQSSTLTLEPPSIGPRVATIAGRTFLYPTREWFDVGTTTSMAYSIDADHGLGMFQPLEPGKTYFYRYVVQKDGKTYRGETRSFTTPREREHRDRHEGSNPVVRIPPAIRRQTTGPTAQVVRESIIRRTEFQSASRELA
jgi:hypothetical protein